MTTPNPKTRDGNGEIARNGACRPPPVGVPFRLVSPATPHDLTREQHDLGHRVITAALAEVGITAKARWSEQKNCYVNEPPVEDLDALNRARVLAMQAVGIPYEIVLTDRAATESEPAANGRTDASAQVSEQ